MSALTDLRVEVTTALAPVIQSTEFLPETITPPVAVVVPGEPYIKTGRTFGTHDVTLSLYLIGGRGTNKSAASAMDTLIEQVIETLPDWNLQDVRQPYTITLNGAKYLATEIDIQTTLKFE